MKKILSYLSIMIVLIVLVGCGGNSNVNDDNKPGEEDDNKITPSGQFENVVIEGYDVTFDASIQDPDNTIKDIKIVLLDGENKLDELTMDDGVTNGLNEGLSFNNLEPKSSYVIEIKIVYDLGEGEISLTLDTNDFVILPSIPTGEIGKVLIDRNKVIFDIDIVDHNQVITNINAKLYKDQTLINELEITDIYKNLEFLSLEDESNYELVLDITYNLNDGNGDIILSNSSSKSFFTFNTDSIIDYFSIYSNDVVVNEKITTHLEVDTPISLDIATVTVNGESYNVQGTTGYSFRMDINSGNVPGNIEYRVEEIGFNYNNKVITHKLGENNKTVNSYVFDNVLIEDIVCEKEIVEPGQDMLITMNIKNPSGYLIDTLKFGKYSQYIITDFEEITDNTISFYIPASDEIGYNSYPFKSIIYSNDVGRQIEIQNNDILYYFVSDTNDINYIETIEDLKQMNDHRINILKNDIDLSGENWIPISFYQSYLDGNGYKISNMKITNFDYNSFTYYVGFFNSTSNSYIKNLKLENIDINISKSGYDRIEVGAIAGYNSGAIINSSATGNIEVTSEDSSITIGGLVGWAKSGVIKKSSSDVNVNLSADNNIKDIYFGGLIGYSECYVKDSFSLGDISADIKQSGSKTFIGGFVGMSWEKIENSYSNSNITLSSGNESNIGGFVGKKYKDINNSYATGNIIVNITADGRTFNVGSFIGFYGSAVIDNSFAVGNITANGYTDNLNLGSFIGYSENSNLVSLHNSYTFDSQHIMINGEESVSNSYGIQTDAEHLNSRTFYLDTLKFDPTIWNIKDNELPTIIR